MEQALVDVGLPETLVAEVEWRLKALGKLLGQNLWADVPHRCLGAGPTYELTRVRGWDKNLPGKLLGALPKQKWVRQLQHRGQDLLATLWQQVEDKSPATRSRWQWTWVGDDSVFKKYGQQLGLVGTWYSGQEHRVRLGIDGLLLVVVIGEGKLVIPVDFTVRRPDPVGPGGALPRQADLAAGDAGSDVGRSAAAAPAAASTPGGGRQLVWRLEVAGACGAPAPRHACWWKANAPTSSICATGAG